MLMSKFFLLLLPLDNPMIRIDNQGRPKNKLKIDLISSADTFFSSSRNEKEDKEMFLLLGLIQQEDEANVAIHSNENIGTATSSERE